MSHSKFQNILAKVIKYVYAEQNIYIERKEFTKDIEVSIQKN